MWQIGPKQLDATVTAHTVTTVRRVAERLSKYVYDAVKVAGYPATRLGTWVSNDPSSRNSKPLGRFLTTDAKRVDSTKITRPPSPPSSRRSNGSGPGRGSGTGSHAHSGGSSAKSQTVVTPRWWKSAAIMGGSRQPLHDGGGTAVGYATLMGQTRTYAMPAVASRPETLRWFDRPNQPSIFELFEQATKEPATIRRSFRFTHAASALPKNQRSLPKDDGGFLSVQVGEDAFFTRHDSLGVADGVGGWSQVQGANPALYSRKLMHYASAELEKYDDIAAIDYDPKQYDKVDPKEVLQKSYDAVCADAKSETLVGSSTAVIAILRDDELRVANLGDCGVMIIRNNEAIFRTEEQQHSFNFPYQLGTGSQDSPSDAQSFRVKVQEGDIVILASDGMFDNVFDDEVVDIVKRVLGEGGEADPQDLADALMRRARDVAEEGRFATSPFQSRAIAEGLYYQGGKMDDVTVLAAIVRLSEDSPDRR